MKRQGHGPVLGGNRVRPSRIWSNWLSNPIRHTTSGQAVNVSLRQEQQSVVITVSNPGDTIAPEHLPHLFDRFYRVDPARQRNGDGAGLGLAIVKSIAEAHGGEIAARSSNGNTAFELRLPCALH